MQEIREIGKVSWTKEEIKAAIPEFTQINKNRPLSYNKGGMTAPHMFAFWFMMKKLQPKVVIESGVWRGQSTWFIEQTLPNAKVISLDPRLDYREYISDKVTYYSDDFSKIDWSFLENKDEVLCFFDDHQNALERVKQCKEKGFKHFIFEDNYPMPRGGCYSLKKVFHNCGFEPEEVPPRPGGLKNKIKFLFKVPDLYKVEPSIPANTEDSSFLKQNLSVYYEFPPVFKPQETRWGDPWTDDQYPTPDPLYADLETEDLQQFYDEAKDYTWICYAELN